MAHRFRGFLPVVIDVETGGFNAKTDALLEIAAVLLDFSDDGALGRTETIRYHVKPFEGANMDPASLAVMASTQIIRCAPPSMNAMHCSEFFARCGARSAKRAAIEPSSSVITRHSTSAF